MLKLLKQELQEQATPEKAKLYSRFFKTDKGHYGEGDVFLGLTVPEQRALAKKYVGWMPREVGKRDKAALERFLDRHYKQMPRTMLRYAIERLDKAKKIYYME